MTVLAFVFPSAFALGLEPRLAAVLLVLPLGILMGCPFPLALRSLGENGLEEHTALLWGVNGVASVLGSALAMIIGLSWGASDALFVGAGIYVGVAALFAASALLHPAASSERSLRRRGVALPASHIANRREVTTTQHGESAPGHVH